ncbi:mevalonate kinase [Nocardiopsis rhodophaea]|uniref:mevalonate kinase n=1 Tax=Nocardiopsis rhodophaea TaxID=280238 RepID=UPI0031E2A292
MSSSDEVGIGRAHGKAILLGEHAVVYGAPALAIPVPQLTVTASAAWFARQSGGPDEISFMMTASEPVVSEAAGGLRRLVGEFRRVARIADDRPIDLLVDCMIPPGRGLGSSAACSRAVVLALARLYHSEISAKQVFDLVQTAEKEVHGKASGIDTHATGSPYSIFFSSSAVQEIRVGFDGLFVIADSGAAGRTKDAVELLAGGFERDPRAKEEFVRRVSSLGEGALEDLVHGRANDFGARLTENHELLSSAGISTPLIDKLVSVALDAGSLGAKITGGGLGGCMIALAREPHRAQEAVRRLRDAGAVQTWIVPVGMFAGHVR